MRGAAIQTRSLSIFGSISDSEALLALSIWEEPPRRTTTELDQMSANVFEGPNLENGDMMIVLSSTEAVEVRNAKVVNGSILVVAQMPVELLARFATQLGVTFTLSEYGVYCKTFRPDNRK